MKGSFLTLIALVICYLLLHLMPGHTPVSDIPYFTSSDVSVIAHRGGRGLRPRDRASRASFLGHGHGAHAVLIHRLCAERRGLS